MRPHAFDGKRRLRGHARTRIMLFPAVLFFVNAFRSDGAGMLGGLAAGVLIFAAAHLTREGLKAAQEYDARRVAKRPALPRKIFGAALTGLALAAGAAPQSLGLAVGAGIAGVLLHLAAFGPDPLRDKGLTGDDFQNDRVARAVDEGEKHLAAMQGAIQRLRDPALEARVDRFTATARSLFRQVEADPGDLSAARKYLGVYLMGARDATVKFADLYAARRDPDIRSDYESLLTDLETTFAGRSTALLRNDRTDLDVEIEVLRERLMRDAPELKR